MAYGWVLGAFERGNVATKAHAVKVADLSLQIDPKAIRRAVGVSITQLQRGRVH